MRTRERFAATDRPRPASDPKVTRRVPADTLRAAYRASSAQCQYVSPDGRRCSARGFLEADHVLPRALGGGHDQIRILCRLCRARHKRHYADRRIMPRRRGSPSGGWILYAA
jgi:5-methylcytosine-specific restriction endonuclease McrA